MRNKRRRFYCVNHQGKANPYVVALRDRGWRQSALVDRAQFALLDHDTSGRARLIDSLDMPVFLYPHTTRPFLQYDGMYPPHPKVTAMFTIGIGQRKITQLFVDRPVHAVGWALCEMGDFRRNRNPRKVLFAPIHVNGNGFLSPREKDTNRRAFEKLLTAKDELEIKVRFLHDLQQTGLWVEDGVEYIFGNADQTHEEIDWADVVIAHQTMAYIAIARGAPTLMMDEHLRPMSGSSANNIRYVQSWGAYRHKLMFPHDFLADGGAMEKLREAAKGQAKIRDWRRRFIGEPFDANKFVDILESYL